VRVGGKESLRAEDEQNAGWHGEGNALPIEPPIVRAFGGSAFIPRGWKEPTWYSNVNCREVENKNETTVVSIKTKIEPTATQELPRIKPFPKLGDAVDFIEA
jgi:hypothetical protein